MTPAQELSVEIISGFEVVLKFVGMEWTPQQKADMYEQISRSIQKVADEQQQSDAQAFGDECECDYGESADITVIITPLFPAPSGNN